MMLCGMGKYGRVMTQYIGIVYDVIFLLLVLGAAEAGRRRGFASGLVSFIGSVAGIIGGTYGTRVWAAAFMINMLPATLPMLWLTRWKRPAEIWPRQSMR